jgi:hypothetical protein
MPVSLPRGWGAILYVGGPNHEPLEGVQVFLDGRPRGFTGSHGRVCLAGERPSAITLRYEDWSIYDGDIHIDGSFDDAEAWMNAYLEPSRPR